MMFQSVCVKLFVPVLADYFMFAKIIWYMSRSTHSCVLRIKIFSGFKSDVFLTVFLTHMPRWNCLCIPSPAASFFPSSRTHHWHVPFQSRRSSPVSPDSSLVCMDAWSHGSSFPLLISLSRTKKVWSVSHISFLSSGFDSLPTGHDIRKYISSWFLLVWI